MAEFKGILELMQSNGIGSSMFKILENQKRLTKMQSDGIGSSMFKILENQKRLTNILSHVKINEINEIVKFQERMTSIFENSKISTVFLSQHQSVFFHINNWQFAINGISNQLTAFAASQGKWDLIDDFSGITQEAIALNERIGNNTTPQELKDFFQRIENKIDKIDKNDTGASSILLKLLNILCFIMAASGEWRNWSLQPEYATKQNVESIIREQFKNSEKQLKENKQSRIINRECKVMLKPNFKSQIVRKLPINFEIIVLAKKHKWVYISYFDPKDNLPQAGWVMTKYLK